MVAGMFSRRNYSAFKNTQGNYMIHKIFKSISEESFTYDWMVTSITLSQLDKVVICIISVYL
jgi:hypothetical protein